MQDKLPELLPCPFCGEIPTVYSLDTENHGDFYADVVCVNEACPVHPMTYSELDHNDDTLTSTDHKRDAINRWNSSLIINIPSIIRYPRSEKEYKKLRTLFDLLIDVIGENEDYAWCDFFGYCFCFNSLL